MKKVKDGVILKLPPLPEACYECGRKFDARVLNNPYGCWSIPNMNGNDGKTRCTYCDEAVRRGFDFQKNLKPGCEALEQLDRWLAVEAKGRMWWAHLETRHYTFDAFGKSKKDALAAMEAGWKRHQERTGAELTFEELLEGGDATAKEVRLGSCLRDGDAI